MKKVLIVGGTGGKALGFQVDVRKQDQVQGMVDTAVREFGELNILVNNAGAGKIIPFFETTEADWDLMFDVNCKGLLWASQAAAKQMIKQGKGGKIINLASQAGRRREAHVLAYCASKACVINMNQSIALALAEHKINVNALAPGISVSMLTEETGPVEVGSTGSTIRCTKRHTTSTFLEEAEESGDEDR